MIEFHAQIKGVHVLAILCSGALFALRGSGLLLGMRWPMAAPVRYVSYTIDTVLLTAAMMLLTLLPSGLYANGWLATKLALVLCYILLGVFAFKRDRSKRSRAILFIAAVLVYAQIYCIARTHHPLGALLLLLG
jgi:uncharacterized membrane protein SirB2